MCQRKTQASCRRIGIRSLGRHDHLQRGARHKRLEGRYETCPQPCSASRDGNDYLNRPAESVYKGSGIQFTVSSFGNKWDQHSEKGKRFVEYKQRSLTLQVSLSMLRVPIDHPIKASRLAVDSVQTIGLHTHCRPMRLCPPSPSLSIVLLPLHCGVPLFTGAGDFDACRRIMDGKRPELPTEGRPTPQWM